ncbi:MAG: hypothetical protein V7641_60 [Blastocatellia bacterium]
MTRKAYSVGKLRRFILLLSGLVTRHCCKGGAHLTDEERKVNTPSALSSFGSLHPSGPRHPIVKTRSFRIERRQQMSNNKQRLMGAILLVGILVTLMLSKWIVVAQPALSQQTQHSSDTGRWEYRILTSSLSDAIGFNRGPMSTSIIKGKMVSGPLPGPSLEERLRDFVDQGFVVESFQTLLAIDLQGSTLTGLSARSEPTIVVLLKRQK